MTLTTILNGESFYVDFNLTLLFGKVIDTTTYVDVKIYLYHKQLLKNIGFDAATEYWGNVDGNITIGGVDSDQARILVPDNRTEDILKGTYMYMVELENDPVYEKEKGDAFQLKTAIDE